MQWANEQVIKFNGDNQAHRLDTGIVFFGFVAIGRYGKWLTGIHSY